LVSGLKLISVERAFAEKHYADLSAKPFFSGLVDYIISGPVVAMIWEGKNVVLTGRKIIGATNPAQSEPGTIRGDYAIDIGRYKFVFSTILFFNLVIFSSCNQMCFHCSCFWSSYVDIGYLLVFIEIKIVGVLVNVSQHGSFLSIVYVQIHILLIF